MPIAGVSETERRRRKESNLFTTKINFYAWLLEVLKIFQKSNQKYNQLACSYLVQRLPWCTLSPKRSGLRLRSYGSKHSMKKTGTSRGTRFLPFFMQDSEKYSYYGKILVDLKKGPHQILVQNLGKILKTRKNTLEIRKINQTQKYT